MADNTTLNAGSGGDVIASDDISGVKFQRIKLIHGADGVNAGDVSTVNPLPVDCTADPAATFPSYGPTGPTGLQALSVDEYGALVTRGAILTDEGTFRINFANTSLATSLGSVTVVGNIVTGSGFNTSDVHWRDYFKVSADADSAYTQIASVDSDTQITLVSDYLGLSSSGAASRSLVQPYTGSGGSISVASGQLTMTSGTTNGAKTGIKRLVDYAPMVFRSRFSVSQRIANQYIVSGLMEDSATPRWFARFYISGTTNTTIKTQSGRNPTSAPSASEIEEYTVTLPNGATTALMNDYRVEMLTESVRFYVNGILVAEHVKVVPQAYDIFDGIIEINNETGAGSSTTLVVDYMTCKNHNKLEVGLMSDVEKIVANQPPLVEYTFSQAGVIAINADLMVFDCTQLRGLFIQCTSMGTTGVITPAWSNDGVTFVNGTMFTPAFVAATTFNAAGLWYIPTSAKYLRLRLTTATTAGTTTLNVKGTQFAPQAFQATQPISGTVTANIGTGSLAAGTNAIGDVGLQVRANATGAATVSKFTAAATTNAASIKVSAGRVLGWHLYNTTASAKYFRFFNKASAPTVGTDSPVFVIVVPANSAVFNNLPTGIAFTTGIAIACTGAVADLDTTVTAANDVIGSFYYA